MPRLKILKVQPWLRKLSFGLLLLLAGVARTASAHDVPPSIVMLDIGLTKVDAEIQLPLSELGSALNLPLADHPEAAVAQYGDRLSGYVGAHLQITSPQGAPFGLRVQSLGLKTTDNANWTSNQWLVVQISFEAPAGTSTAQFDFDDSAILHTVLSHEALIYVRTDIRNGLLGGQPLLIGTAAFGAQRLHVDGSDGSWWKGFKQLFALGLRHIAAGLDHLLFLLVLLLPSPLIAAAGRWQARKSNAAATRTIVLVVTGFTLGHSLSLAVAALGWITAPTNIVEVLIAVSILVSCLHAWRPLFAGREVWIASAFGLIHGLAFAEVLQGLKFDAASLAVSLVAFNLGIETMQLAVIVATLPILLLLSKTRGYREVRLAGAAFAAACASGWILERAFDMSNPLKTVSDWLAPPPNWFFWSLCIASFGCLALLLRGRAVTR